MRKLYLLKTFFAAIALSFLSIQLNAKRFEMPPSSQTVSCMRAFVSLPTTWDHQLFVTVCYPDWPSPLNVPAKWKSFHSDGSTPEFTVEIYGPVFSHREFHTVTEINPYFDYFRAWWPYYHYLSKDQWHENYDYFGQGHWNDDDSAIEELDVIYQSGENYPTFLPVYFDDSTLYGYMIWYIFKRNSSTKKNELIAYYLNKAETFIPSTSSTSDLYMIFEIPDYNDFTCGSAYLEIQ